MSAAITVTVVTDTATQAIAEVQRKIGDPATLKLVGQIAAEAYRAHLYRVHNTRPNRLGGPRTGYYKQAGDRTSWRVNDGARTAIVSIAQVGIRLHAEGGTVVPKVAKRLAIPATASAHGTRPIDSQWRDKLRPVFGRGGRVYALAAKADFERVATKGKNAGSVTSLQTGQKANSGEGGIVFWLVPKATIPADPTVLPTAQTVLTKIASALSRYLRAKS